MGKHHGTETLTFEGFSGYYGSVPQGYGGLIWSDVDYLNASYWQNEKTNWCDTGYQNVVDGNGLAYTWGQQGAQSFGYFASPSPAHTFSLVSMVAASAWETNQPFTFISYVYKPVEGFVVKAEITLHLSQTAQKLVFADLPNLSSQRADFQNISAVRIISGAQGGTYGNTCSYGQSQHTYGNELAFDDLQITWNGGIPHGNGKMPAHPLLPGLRHGHGTPAAHLVGVQQAAHGHAVNGPDAASHHDASGYHTELMSLSGHDSVGLTTQFHLPAVEHFGT